MTSRSVGLIVVSVLVLIIVGVIVYLWSAFSRTLSSIKSQIQQTGPDSDEFIRDIIGSIRGTSGTPRYELALSDWGDQAPSEQMRWQWSIWDADRILMLALDHADTDAPGVLTPFWLGNAATRPEAEANALTWMAGNGGQGVVV